MRYVAVTIARGWRRHACAGRTGGGPPAMRSRLTHRRTRCLDRAGILLLDIHEVLCKEHSDSLPVPYQTAYRLPINPRKFSDRRLPRLAAAAHATQQGRRLRPLAQGLPIKRFWRSLRSTRMRIIMSAPAKQSARQSNQSAAPTNAVTLLTTDHEEVMKLFKSYAALVVAETESADKQALALQICAMLRVHATIEEEVFYPAAREGLKEQDLLDEAEVEHASAKDLIAQIEGMEGGDDLYDAKVKVLGECIDHHVKEEEEELFPKVKRAKLDLEALGVELAARKEELEVEVGQEPTA